MGKWSKLAGSLPTLPSEATYSDAVRNQVDALRGQSLSDLTASYNALREEKMRVEAELSEINCRLEAVTRVIDETMDLQDMESVVMHGYRWTRSPEPYAKVADRQAALAWAKQEMPDALSIHYQILASTTKARLEAGEPPPPGVDVYLRPKISRRKV